MIIEKSSLKHKKPGATSIRSTVQAVLRFKVSPGNLVTRWDQIGRNRISLVHGPVARCIQLSMHIYAVLYLTSAFLKFKLIFTTFLHFGHFISIMPLVTVTLSRILQLQCGHLFAMPILLSILSSLSVFNI